MYYDETLLSQIKNKINIINLIAETTYLKQGEKAYIGNCPFDEEKVDSLLVSKDKQLFHCMNCGANGNVFDFVMQKERISFPDAVQWLGERVGVPVPSPELDNEQLRINALKALQEAGRFYRDALAKEQSALNYTKNQRQLSERTIKRFGIGYAPGNGQLYRHLINKGFSKEELLTAGLISEKDGKINDKFWGRVMFPIFDEKGYVVGFGGRIMDGNGPKYMNSVDSMVFDKSNTIYGLNIAKQHANNGIIFCEGYMDTIAMHQAGFENAVASLGTALTTGHAQKIKAYTDTIYLAYDSDLAGQRAAMRAFRIINDAGMKTKVINLAPYKDPDEFIKAEGCEKFQQRINSAVDGHIFALSVIEKYKDAPQDERVATGDIQIEIAKVIMQNHQEALEFASKEYGYGAVPEEKSTENFPPVDYGEIYTLITSDEQTR